MMMGMGDINNTPKNGYNLISTFSGMGGSCLGFKMAGFDVRAAVEFIPEAANTYKANHIGVPVVEKDIRNINGDELLNIAGLKKGEVHVMEGSPPCLPPQFELITKTGYKPIVDIREGELVYTHNGRLRPVTECMSRDYKGKVYKIFANGIIDPIITTPEHPYLMCRGVKDEYTPNDMFWMSASKLHKGDLLAFHTGESTKNDSFSLSMAQFLGCFAIFGWIENGSVDEMRRVVFNTENIAEVENVIINTSRRLGSVFSGYLYKDKRCVCVEDENLLKLLSLFYDDDGKRIIPESLIHSDMEFLQEFIKPIMWGNKDAGNKYSTYYRSHADLKVLLGLQRIFFRFGAFARVKIQKSKKGNFQYHVIQMSCKDTNQVQNYEAICKNKIDSWFKKGDYAMIMVEEVVIENYDGKVYNLEVDEDNSYCVHGAALHNCSDFSSQHFTNSGKTMGEVKTYSSTKQRVDDLFLEYARLVGDIEPLVFVAENVDSLLDDDKSAYIDSFIDAFERCGSVGYVVSAKKVNFAYYQVPQNRNRTIFVGIRKDLNMFPTFPIPVYPVISTCDAIFDLLNSPPDLEMTDLEKLYARNIPKGSGSDFIYKLRNEHNIPIMVYNHRRDCWDTPHYTLLQNTRPLHQLKNRWLTVAEGKRLQTIPDDFLLTGTTQQQWERIGRSVPPMGMYHIAKHILDNVLLVAKSKGLI